MQGDAVALGIEDDGAIAVGANLFLVHEDFSAGFFNRLERGVHPAIDTEINQRAGF